MTKPEISTTRQAEYEAAKAASRSALQAYWAGSATASIVRDCQAGRLTTIKAGR
jgi:hypothetical protein